MKILDLLRRNYQLLITVACAALMLIHTARLEAKDAPVLDELTVRELKVVDENGNLVCNIGAGSHGASLNLFWPGSQSNVRLLVTKNGSSVSIGEARQGYIGLSTVNGENASAHFLTEDSSAVLGVSNIESNLSLESLDSRSTLVASSSNYWFKDEKRRSSGTSGLYLMSDYAKLHVQGTTAVDWILNRTSEHTTESELAFSLNTDGYSAILRDQSTESAWELSGSTEDWKKLGAMERSFWYHREPED
ncbi:hypothetical protein KDL44_00295 [bacterium]|nr:hypothetical protein [bacterium]